MKTKMRSTVAASNRTRVRTLLSITTFAVLLSILTASAVFTASSASSAGLSPDASRSVSSQPKNAIAQESSPVSHRIHWLSALSPLMPLLADSVATYEVSGGLCTNNLKDTFELGDSVCVKAIGAPLSGRRLSVAGTDGTIADIVDVVTDPQELIYTLPSTTTSLVNGSVVDNRGVWRVTVHATSDFGARAGGFFSVTDPDNAAADLIIFAASTATDPVTPGSATGFSVNISNAGPDAAEDVHVTQNVPANFTFDSATAGTGVSFTCAESAGVVDCVPAGSLASGDFSTFTLNYTVSSGASNAVVTTEIDAASDTTDPRPTTNAAVATVEVRGGGGAPTCVLSCPLNRTVGANTTQSGQPGAIVNFGDDIESSGDCGTVTSTPASGSFFPLGTTTVNVSSATGGGSCSFSITVTEDPAPTITCAADQTATTSGSSNEASVTVNAPTATGTNVVVTGVRNDNRSLSEGYPVGTTTITWTARECTNPPDCDDPNSRFATCTQKIIVTSPDAPTISCPSNKSYSGACEGRTLTSAEIGTPTATGSNVTVAGQRSDSLDLYNDPYPIGTTTITWTATDDGGRQASCTHLITITAGNDTQPPTITAPPNVSVTTSSCGQIVGESELGTAEASDNCGTPNVSRSGVPPGNFFPTGTTTITYTATDGAGNTATATQTVTVSESPAINPTVSAPSDVTLQTGPGATTCGVTVSNLDATLGTATASDNCPGVTVTRIGVPAGNVFPVGTTTVTYRATDRSGNFADDTQVVTVVDNTIPVVTPPPAIMLNTGPGATSCGVTVSDLNATLGTGSATDNCPGVQNPPVRSGVPAGDFFPVGQTTLTYSATDAYGNAAVPQTQVVTVVDNTAPVISCPANIVLEPTCPSGAIATFADATATDNCGVQSVVRTAGPASGSVFPIGTTNVTYTATDIHGNMSSCTFTVTVKTVLQTLADLRTSVAANTQLSPPQRNGLLSKLDAAKQHIENNNQNGACSKLADFVNSTQNFISNGALSATTGNAWISTANNIRNTLGCTNNPCT